MMVLAALVMVMVVMVIMVMMVRSFYGCMQITFDLGKLIRVFRYLDSTVIYIKFLELETYRVFYRVAITFASNTYCSAVGLPVERPNVYMRNIDHTVDIG